MNFIFHSLPDNKLIVVFPDVENENVRPSGRLFLENYTFTASDF